MSYRIAEAGEKPAKVILENLPGKTLVRLTDNVTAYQIDDEVPQVMFRYDEVAFYLPEDRANESAESVEANFSAWWAYGQSERATETISLEERVTTLEEMYMLMMEG